MSKGDSFERETSRAISLWWTDGERDDVFWRNRTRVTSKTPNAERQLGDLTTVHTVGVPFIEVFNVEFKIGYSKTKKGVRHKNIPWDLLDLIDGKGRIFLDFWEQTYEDAIRSGRIPMLIFKRDYHVPVVSMFSTDIDKLADLNGHDVELQYPVLKATVSELDFQEVSLHNFDRFFKWLRPEIIKVLSVQRQIRISKHKKLLRRVSNARSTGDT
jgi:hypothetical protein